MTCMRKTVDSWAPASVIFLCDLIVVTIDYHVFEIASAGVSLYFYVASWMICLRFRWEDWRPADNALSSGYLFEVFEFFICSIFTSSQLDFLPTFHTRLKRRAFVSVALVFQCGVNFPFESFSLFCRTIFSVPLCLPTRLFNANVSILYSALFLNTDISKLKLPRAITVERSLQNVCCWQSACRAYFFSY